MKRSFVLIVAFMLLWACMASSVTALAAQNSSSAPSRVEDIPDNAQHFIVRHWHTTEDISGTQLQGDSFDNTGDHYFVLAEGYTVPQDDGTFKFYFVYQSDDSQGHKAGDLMEIVEDSDSFVHDSSYIEDINTLDGSIRLKPSPVSKEAATGDGEDDGDQWVEEFTSFSVSAGHDAVTYESDGDITITYSPYVHLVKAHAFYIRHTMDVDGTADETVFGSDGLATSAEQDTAKVYTYKENGSDHNAGDIVKNGNKPVTKLEDLPSGVTADDVKLTKLYDTTLGLHTDKTATEVAGSGGRAFNLDLEAWYAEGYAPQVGMVLDASGSMAFASDVPDVIRVTDRLTADQIQALVSRITGISISSMILSLTPSSILSIRIIPCSVSMITAISCTAAKIISRWAIGRA